MCHGFCPVDLTLRRRGTTRTTTQTTGRTTSGKGKAALSGMVLAGLPFLGLGCQPSDEAVARAAEESISGLAQVAVANLKCSVAEALGGGSQATETMDHFSTRMQSLTDTLENETGASNREKMRVISEINDLRDDWEEELESIGCEVTDS